jgi:hypothetical protein
MAVDILALSTSADNRDRQGLSTDEKPTGVESGTTFYEIDTKKIFVYSAANTNPLTSDGWWEM